MKQVLNIHGPPRGELPLWGKRIGFPDFFVELVPAGERLFNVRLSDAFASISFAADEGRSSLAGDRLRSYERLPFEYVVAPPDFPLQGTSDAAPEVLVLIFPFATLRAELADALRVAQDLLEPRVIIGGPAPFTTELAKRIRHHILADDVSQDYLRSLCIVILVEMLTLPPEQRSTRRGKSLDDNVLHSVLKFIDGNLDSDLSIKTLAGVSGVHIHQFARAFKRKVGEAPHRYVLGRRVDVARSLLDDTDHSIAEIAYATGFSSQSHMTSTFRRQIGVTPGQLRHSRS